MILPAAVQNLLGREIIVNKSDERMVQYKFAIQANFNVVCKI
ncbi:Phosphoribosylformylglycinamidine synthase II (FGAM synthase II) (fragment) [Xenorhabdus nematophila ATCC 19061]|uniref:Phosphoribosylformylglycinamidine synthase II (FGAM synthase II) n=1 Tax=Xenorhabdus nematophila (strain ATCC 19061 / DSM 3370 / CCUG 14189 / LMG 1036 / NCIMB 9965 / AN6) TaxID=406817 RepID=D3V8U2_XENNA